MKLKLLAIILTMLSTLIQLNATSRNDIIRVEPPSWWVGMETPLTLMIYGEDLSGSEVKVNTDNISIVKVSNADSPNYLFVDLKFTPELEAGEYKFSVKAKDGRKLSFEYLIENRREGSKDRIGFGKSDVVYLLMPDRFANGDPDNDSHPDAIEKLNRKELGGRHGGDLKGIMRQLDYLSDLGVTTIWPTPVLFDNEVNASYHGYACGDYYKVDPRYGDNEYYQELVAVAHSKGLKFIQDMVPNHCGTLHWWMKDLPFKDWVSVFDEFTRSNFVMSTHSDPNASVYDRDLNITGWFDTTMPDMNLRNPYVLQYFKQNAVWWVEYADLDGIRVDTFPYSDKYKISEWTASILNEYPNLTIMGECWFNTSLEQSYWEGMKLANGEFKTNKDGYTSHLPMVMDFMLMGNLLQAFNENDSIPAWDKGIKKVYNSLSHDFVYEDPYKLLIFLSNHDTPRPAHIFGAGREAESLVLERVKNATTLILTTRGIPKLYSGDEIMLRSADGTTGHVQERVDFPGGWDGDKKNAFTEEGRTPEQNELFDHTRTLLQWRKDSKAIAEGKLKHFFPLSTSNAYIYFRYTENNEDLVMVIINNGVAPFKVDWKVYKEVFGGTTPEMTDILTGKKVLVGEELIVPAMSSMVLE